MVKTYLESLVPEDQIAFLKYIWILKLGISELLLPIQRAHTYSNNLWIVVSEKHQFLAFERKGTAHFTHAVYSWAEMMPVGSKGKECGWTPVTKTEHSLRPWVSGWFCFFICIPVCGLQSLLHIQWNLKVFLSIRTTVQSAESALEFSDRSEVLVWNLGSLFPIQ